MDIGFPLLPCLESGMDLRVCLAIVARVREHHGRKHLSGKKVERALSCACIGGLWRNLRTEPREYQQSDTLSRFSKPVCVCIPNLLGPFLQG